VETPNLKHFNHHIPPLGDRSLPQNTKLLVLWVFWFMYFAYSREPLMHKVTSTLWMNAWAAAGLLWGGARGDVTTYLLLSVIITSCKYTEIPFYKGYTLLMLLKATSWWQNMLFFLRWLDLVTNASYIILGYQISSSKSEFFIYYYYFLSPPHIPRS